MTFSVQRIPDLPVIHIKLSHEYNLLTDYAKSYPAVTALLEKETKPVYYLMDLTDAAFDMEGLIVGTSKTSREDKGTFHNPMVKEVLIVSPNDFIQFAAKGLKSDIYGNVRIKVFSTTAEALNYVRAS